MNLMKDSNDLQVNQYILLNRKSELMEYKTFNDTIVNISVVLLLIYTFNVIAIKIITWWGGGCGKIKFEKFILLSNQRNCTRRAIYFIEKLNSIILALKQLE